MTTPSYSVAAPWDEVRFRAALRSHKPFTPRLRKALKRANECALAYCQANAAYRAEVAVSASPDMTRLRVTVGRLAKARREALVAMGEDPDTSTLFPPLPAYDAREPTSPQPITERSRMTDATPPASTTNTTGSAPKKSEKRQRQKLTAHRWAMDEFNKAAANARAAGLSFGAFIRKVATGDTGERAQRALPDLDMVLLSKVVGLHGKYGSNLNQIAYELHLRGDYVTEAQIREALQQWAELRDANLQALGKLPRGRSLLSWMDLMAEGQQYLDAHRDQETVCIPADFLRRLVGNGAHSPAA